jgi:hypothetical protein
MKLREMKNKTQSNESAWALACPIKKSPCNIFVDLHFIDKLRMFHLRKKIVA